MNKKIVSVNEVITWPENATREAFGLVPGSRSLRAVPGYQGLPEFDVDDLMEESESEDSNDEFQKMVDQFSDFAVIMANRLNVNIIQGLRINNGNFGINAESSE